ncbi:MAG: hypothetical protein OXT49_08660 [Gammaproteobacteria bacterium]|nr:hypothetical protein [Gammaproteobacteria bacterium]
MKKIALALVAAGLSTAAAAGPQDYNYLEGGVSIGFGEANDETKTLSVEGNQRMGNIFFDGALSYIDADGDKGFALGFAGGLALDIAGGEVAVAAGGIHLEPDEGDSSTYPVVSARYTLAGENNRYYDLEYTHILVDDEDGEDENALVLSVEGGDRNTWRYEASFTRFIEEEINGIGVDFIFPLTPQDSGEFVLGATKAWADDSNADSYTLQFGYRLNLD